MVKSIKFEVWVCWPALCKFTNGNQKQQHMKSGIIVKATYVIGWLFAIVGAYLKITHSEGGEIVLRIGLIVWLTFIVTAIYEVRTSNRINNTQKTMWTIALILLCGVAGLIYLLSGRRRIATIS